MLFPLQHLSQFIIYRRGIQSHIPHTPQGLQGGGTKVGTPYSETD